MAFVRERQIYTSTRKGEEMKEIEIYVMTEGKERFYGSHRSRKRVALTCPKQANLNDKRSRIHFDRLANTNFGIGDLHESLTYTDQHLPIDIAEGEANMNRYIARIRPIYEKAGIPFRYIWLTSYYTDSDDIPVRMHHHILLPGGVDRDLLEDLWRAKSPKRGKLGEKLGAVNCDRIQPDGNGISALCAYLARQPKEGNMRRWHSSIGLKKPTVTEPDDDKYDFRDLKKMVEDNADRPDVAFWEKQYPGWTLQDDRQYAYTVANSEISGPSIRVKLRKLTEKELSSRYDERIAKRKKRLVKRIIKNLCRRIKRQSKANKNERVKRWDSFSG